MVPPNDLKEIVVETPFGTRKVKATLWEKGEPDEHWAVNQKLVPHSSGPCNDSAGKLLQFYLQQYTIGLELAERGYTVEERLDDKTIAWTRYTSED
jgi:hypothetical protein